MYGLVIEVVMVYLFGVVTAIYRNSSKRKMKKAGDFAFKVMPIIWLVAIILDPFLPFPNTPPNHFISLIGNTYLLLCFYLGYGFYGVYKLLCIYRRRAKK